MERDMWITTEDNPFDPFTQMDRWADWDEDHGYYTREKLAYLSGYSHNLSPAENNRMIDAAIRDLVRNGFVTYIDEDGKHTYLYVPAIKGKTVPWN